MKTTAEISVVTKFDHMEVDAEWGYFEIDTVTEFYMQCKEQLSFFLRNDRSPDPTYTRDEIMALDELLDLQCQKTAMAMFHMRGICNKWLGFSVPYASVVQTLKQQNHWPVRAATKITVDLAHYVNLKERHNAKFKAAPGVSCDRSPKLSLRTKSP